MLKMKVNGMVEDQEN